MAGLLNQAASEEPEEGLEMSEEGLISVRLQKTLVNALQAATQQQGVNIHEGSGRLISRLPSLTVDELRALKDPPRELGMARLSLYVGWDSVSALSEAARDSNLSVSTIFRRLLYAFLISGQLRFVQRGERWRLQIVSEKHLGNPTSDGGQN